MHVQLQQCSGEEEKTVRKGRGRNKKKNLERRGEGSEQEWAGDWGGTTLSNDWGGTNTLSTNSNTVKVGSEFRKVYPTLFCISFHNCRKSRKKPLEFRGWKMHAKVTKKSENTRITQIVSENMTMKKRVFENIKSRNGNRKTHG